MGGAERTGGLNRSLERIADVMAESLDNRGQNDAKQQEVVLDA